MALHPLTKAIMANTGRALSPKERREVEEMFELMDQPSKVPTSEEEIEARFKARQAKPHFDFHTYSDGLGE